MELAVDAELVGFPTATPALDVLRPLPDREPGRLTAGDYFFISSAIVVAFTELQILRRFLDSVLRSSPLVFVLGIFIIPLAAFLAATAVHSAGHLIAGRLSGFEAIRIKVGRFYLLNSPESTDVFSLGDIIMRPAGGENLPRRLAWLVLGGPIASLLAPLLLEMFLGLARSYAGGIHFLLFAAVHLFSTISVLAGIGSLLPDLDSTGNFSDGTRLLMLLKDDPRGVRILSMLELQVRLNSEKHPRTWGEDLIANTLSPQDESFDGVAGNWLAYLWANARQDLGLATKCLETALLSLDYSPGHLRDRIFLEAAFFQAWYRHNRTKADFWLSQITHPENLSLLERKRLEIAVCWSEGKSFDAWEKLVAYLHWLRKLPVSFTRSAAERDTLEWKSQMESRMLAGAWATMHSWPHQRQTQSMLVSNGAQHG